MIEGYTNNTGQLRKIDVNPIFAKCECGRKGGTVIVESRKKVKIISNISIEQFNSLMHSDNVDLNFELIRDSENYTIYEVSAKRKRFTTETVEESEREEKEEVEVKEGKIIRRLKKETTKTVVFEIEEEWKSGKWETVREEKKGESVREYPGFVTYNDYNYEVIADISREEKRVLERFFKSELSNFFHNRSAIETRIEEYEKSSAPEFIINDLKKIRENYLANKSLEIVREKEKFKVYTALERSARISRIETVELEDSMEYVDATNVKWLEFTIDTDEYVITVYRALCRGFKEDEEIRKFKEAVERKEWNEIVEVLECDYCHTAQFCTFQFSEVFYPPLIFELKIEREK